MSSSDAPPLTCPRDGKQLVAVGDDKRFYECICGYRFDSFLTREAAKDAGEDRFRPRTKQTLSPEEAASTIMGEMVVCTMEDTEEILFYHGGIYKRGGEAGIKAWLEKNVEGCTMNLVNETLEHVRRRTYVSRDRFDEEKFVLNLRNGLYNVLTGELKDHTPDYLSLVQLPVSLDPGAVCSEIRAFLGQVFYPEDLQLVQEYVGYLLWREYKVSKALLLVGDGENGKSTFIGVIKALLGHENYSARSLQDLEVNRFSKADLYNKLANLYADLPGSALSSTGTFKMLTGGDPITAEHKFQRSFNFVNYAKLIFSANRVPEVFEDTVGFFRRWLIVTFPNSFPLAKANKDLLSKLTTDEELSGFLNWALEGLRRLRANGWNFSGSKSTDEVREEYIRKSSPIRAFLMDCTEVRSDAFVSKKDAYGAFTSYCRKRKLPAVTDQTFFKNLPQFAAVNEVRPHVEGRQIRGYTGLSVKPEAEWITAPKVGETLDSLASLDSAEDSSQASQGIHPPSHFSSHSCAVCHKDGARGLVRESGVVYLHPDCENEWGGKL